MTNIWTSALDRFHVILLDYSAFFEIVNSSVFKSLTETILLNRIQVVICSSFKYYETCISRAQNPKETHLILQTEEFLEVLSSQNLLVCHSFELSMYALLPQYSARKDVGYFTSRHSSDLNQIRLEKFEGECGLFVFDSSNFAVYPDLRSFIMREEPYVVNPVSSSFDYLELALYVNVGDKVYSENGLSIMLSEKISTGSEGVVFRTQDPKKVAKIYHRGVMTALRWMKLTRMTRIGLDAKGICWPSSLLFNQNREPVGFLMPAAQGYTLGTVFDGEDAIVDRFPEWDRSSVVQAACQIFEKIIYLHLHGILIGDIQLKNFMIKEAEQVFLIDMDSVQLQDLPCPVGTEEFTPPELWDQSFSAFLRESQQEDYSCGILAFCLLFCGQHPYNQRLGKETLREEIASLAFPYNCGQAESIAIPMGGYDKIWQAIPVSMQEMFCGAFKNGKRYHTVAWYAALVSYRDQLSQKFFQDIQAYKLFPYRLKNINEQPEKCSVNKRTIRDCIIHVPESPDKISVSSNHVMYKGVVTNAAFVNQEKLAEYELARIGHHPSNNLADPLESDVNYSGSTRSPGHRIRHEKPREPANRRKTDRKPLGNKVTIRILIILFLLSAIALGVLTFWEYFT